MAKILIVNIPYAGHINPTLGLVTGLVNNGHVVDYVCAEEWRNKIETTGATLIPYINYPTIPSNSERTLRCYMAAYTTALMVGKEYDLIIYEMFFFLGHTLSKQLGKPTIRLFSTHATNDNVVEDMFKTGSLLNHLPIISNIRRKSARLRWRTDLLAPWVLRKEKDRFFEIARCIPALNIVFTIKEFQIRGNEFDHRFKFVGCPILERKEDVPSNWNSSFLDTDRPLIYISMGTVFRRGIHFYKKCIHAFANSDYHVIMSVGRHFNIHKLGTIPSNIQVYNFVPQLHVLKQASLFITHGGMNSINEAIYYLVPMIVIPYKSDQPINSLRVEALNIGKAVNSKVSYKKLRAIASYVISDSMIKEGLAHLNHCALNAGGIEKAIEYVEEYINHKVKVS